MGNAVGLLTPWHSLCLAAVRKRFFVRRSSYRSLQNSPLKLRLFLNDELGEQGEMLFSDYILLKSCRIFTTLSKLECCVYAEVYDLMEN